MVVSTRSGLEVVDPRRGETGNDMDLGGERTGKWELVCFCQLLTLQSLIHPHNALVREALMKF